MGAKFGQRTRSTIIEWHRLQHKHKDVEIKQTHPGKNFLHFVFIFASNMIHLVFFVWLGDRGFVMVCSMGSYSFVWSWFTLTIVTAGEVVHSSWNVCLSSVIFFNVILRNSSDPGTVVFLQQIRDFLVELYRWEIFSLALNAFIRMMLMIPLHDL